MKIGNGFFSEPVLEGGFEGGGDVVGLAERQVGAEADVQVDHGDMADHAGAQVVGFGNAGGGAGHGQDLLAHFGRKTLVGQQADLFPHDLPGDAQEEQADEQGGDGVQDQPVVAEEGGGADADRRSQGGIGVGPVVPGIGDQR